MTWTKLPALRYAAAGWWVLPLHSVNKEGGCDCGRGCASPGKHPRTEHGLTDATTDEATICAWWTRWPNANVGIRTGAASGLVVLDVDPRHGGDESLAELELRVGPLPRTVEVLTGGAGRHRYFRHPGNGQIIHNATGLGGLRGLDLRGDGGYVVAPPSMHASGRRYEWEASSHPDDMPLAPFPTSLTTTGLATPEARRSDRGDDRRIPEGKRNATLASLGGAMRRHGFSPDAIKAALIAENASRCNPPLPDGEVEAVAMSVGRYPSVDRHPARFSSPVRDASWDENLASLFTTAQELAAEAPATVPYIVEGLVATGALTELVGKIKSSGKTTLNLALVRAVTTGRTFAGLATRQTRVVYLTEQGPSSFLPMLRRAGLADSRDVIVLPWPRAARMPWPAVVDAAVRKAKEVGAVLLVVDTIGQWAGLQGDDENSAGAALAAVRPLQLAAAEGLAVLVDRHARKSEGSIGEEGRGSSAFSGAMDILLSLRRAEGNQPRVRVLHCISPLRETTEPLTITLTATGEYVALGDAGTSAVVLAKDELLACVPRGTEDAISIDALARAAKIRRSEAKAAADAYVRDGTFLRCGTGKKGSPFLYCLAPKDGKGVSAGKPVPTPTYMAGPGTGSPAGLRHPDRGDGLGRRPGRARMAADSVRSVADIPAPAVTPSHSGHRP